MGAKSLTLELSRSNPAYRASQESSFLTSWVYYHDTLAGFSNPLLCQDNPSCNQASVPRVHHEGRTTVCQSTSAKILRIAALIRLDKSRLWVCSDALWK